MTNEITTMDFPVYKVDDDKHLVFGWANVPRPASTVSKSYEGSVEEALEKINNAYREQFMKDTGYAYVLATYPTYVIGVQESYGNGEYECKYYQHGYSATNDDSITFETGVEVELAFVYKEMAKKIVAENSILPDETLAIIGKNLFDKVKEALQAGMVKEDLQGDVVPLDELEKAAYEFVLKSRAAGVDHEQDGNQPRVIGQLVESFFATEEKYISMGIPEDVAKTLNQGWFVGFKIEDEEIWKSVKDGKYKMFSVGGRLKKTSI